MRKKGFTLVELLAVIAILAVLIILALPNILKIFNKSREDTFVDQVYNLVKAAENTYMSNPLNDRNLCFDNKTNPISITGNSKLIYRIDFSNTGKVISINVVDENYKLRISNVNGILLEEIGNSKSDKKYKVSSREKVVVIEACDSSEIRDEVEGSGETGDTGDSGDTGDTGGSGSTGDKDTNKVLPKIKNVTQKKNLWGVTTDKESLYTYELTVEATSENNNNLMYSFNGEEFTTSNKYYFTTGGEIEVKIKDKNGNEDKTKTTLTIESGIKIVIPNGIKASPNKCILKGKCNNGTDVYVKVNNSEINKFYVINDTGNKLSLIMNKNLSTESAWFDENEWYKITTNAYGPLIALDTLKNETSNWSNIPNMNYVLNDDGGDDAYSSTTISNVKTRLISLTEVNNVGCTSSDKCPKWLYENLDKNKSYWTSAASNKIILNLYAWTIDYNGNQKDVHIINKKGIRPVIDINK